MLYVLYGAVAVFVICGAGFQASSHCSLLDCEPCDHQPGLHNKSSFPQRTNDLYHRTHGRNQTTTTYCIQKSRKMWKKRGSKTWTSPLGLFLRAFPSSVTSEMGRFRSKNNRLCSMCWRQSQQLEATLSKLWKKNR